MIRRISSRLNISQISQRNVRASYILSYLGVMLLVLLLFSPALFWGIDSIKGEVRARKVNQLRLILSRLDSEISGYRQHILTLEELMADAAVYSEPFTASEIYSLRDQQLRLQKLIVNRDYVDEAMLVYENKLLVTTQYIFDDSSKFNDYYIKGNSSGFENALGRLKTNVRNREYGIAWYGETWRLQHGSGMTMEYYLPLRTAFRSSPASVVLFVNLDILAGELSAAGVDSVLIQSPENGTLLLSSHEGDDLLLLDKPEREANPLVEELSSSSLGLSFVLLLSEEALRVNVGDISLLLFVYLNLVFMICITVSVLLARHQAKPIEHIYSDINPDSRELSVIGYSDIKSSIHTLQDSIKQYEDRIGALRQLQNTAAFERLLWGIESRWPDNMAADFLEKIRFDRFRVALFIYHPVRPNEPYRSDMDLLAENITRKFIYGEYGRELYIHLVQTGCFLAILPAEYLQVKDCRSRREYWFQAAGMVEDDYGFRLNVCFSHEYSSPAQIRDAYSHLRLFASRSVSEQTGIHYLDEVLADSHKLLSSKVLASLYDALVDGSPAAQKHLKEIWLQIGPASRETEAQLYYTIKNVLDNACSQLPAEFQPSYSFTLADASMPGDQVILKLLSYAKNIAEAYGEVKQCVKNPLIALILEYMENNFSDSDLYGKSVAEKFNISEKYFYTLFKSTTEISFSDYLTTLRLNEAVRLLVYGKMSIGDIALQVGFNSSDTFTKAFKRVYGTTPGSFRRSQVSY